MSNLENATSIADRSKFFPDSPIMIFFLVCQELLKKRDESLGEYRRKRIEGIFAKKRSLMTKIPEKSPFDKQIEEWKNKQYTLQDFSECLSGINSDDRLLQYFGAIGICKLLSNADEQLNQRIQMVLDSNVLPRLISFTKRLEDPILQHEAIWILSSMTAGTYVQTRSVVEKGGIEAFERMLTYEKSEKVEAIFGLGNIAGDNVQFRDQLLKHSNALRLLIDLVEKSDNLELIQKGTWALSNLTRGKPLPPFELVKEAIPVLSKVFQQTQDISALNDAVWALLYLTQGDGIDLVLETEICPSLVTHLKLDQEMRILSPLVKIVGNILSGSEEQANELLKVPNLVERLVELATKHQKKSTVREVCWALSNLTAGTSEQVQLLLNNPEHIISLMKLSENSTPEVLREVLYIFSNATSKATPAQLTSLWVCNPLDFFIRNLNHTDTENVKIALAAVKNILDTGALIAKETNGENPFITKFEDLDGITLLENLQTHPDTDIYERVTKILKTHYELDGENEDQDSD